MRNMILLLACATALSAHATIHRVNNTGIAVDFTTLQDAHDAAADGDTIHVEPSGSTYGACTFTKPLVVIGPGYFLNFNAGLQATSATAITGGLLFEAGSEGCVVSGLDVQGASRVKASFVRIERCRFSSGGADFHVAYPVGALNLTGIVVNGCHVANGFVVGYSRTILNDLTISNTMARTFNFSTGGNTTGELINCFGEGNGTTALFGGSGMSISNCIFGPFVTPGTSSYSNNLFAGAPIAATNGNQINVDLSSVFVGGTGDAQYQLAVGSPAIGAGVGGTDCGIFAGLEPYMPSGIPPVPSIFMLNAPTSTDQGAPLPVTISSRANN